MKSGMNNNNNANSNINNNKEPENNNNAVNNASLEIYTVELFSDLHPSYFWYNLKAVQVEYVWKDVKRNRLILFLLDRNRDKLAAIVPSSLMKLYEDMDLSGGLFSISRIRLEGLFQDVFPRYEGYSLIREEWEILISKDTKFFRLNGNAQEGFPVYPIVDSLRTFAYDKTSRKMIIDVVGKVITGGLITYTRRHYLYRLHSCELFLGDSTGQIMKLILHRSILEFPSMLAKAIKNKEIIYVTRVKLVHLEHVNILVSTALTNVEFNTKMPEAENMRKEIEHGMKVKTTTLKWKPFKKCGEQVRKI